MAKDNKRKMKNSGIEWIGEIPYSWDIIKNKYVVDLYTGNSIKDDEKYLYTNRESADIYLSSKNIDVKNGSLILDDTLYVKKNNNTFVRAHANDILMCIEGGSAGRKKTFLDKTVTFVNKLCCFHSIGIFPKYLYYILQSPHYENEFNLNMSGMIGGVTKGKLDNFIYPFPTIEEQKEIANFLDKKNKAIDSLIDNEELQIEKLKEYKQSLITEVVTKGLDKNVEMKDSGVEWIGKIPKDWEVIKLKYIATSNDESIAESDINDSVIKYVDIGSVSFENGVEHIEEIKFKDAPSRARRITKKGDLIVSTVRTYLKAIATINESNIIVSTGFCVIRNKSVIINKFLEYVCKSDFFTNMVSSQSIGVNYPSISSYQLMNLYIAMPDIKVQEKIVLFLNDKINKVEKMINIKKEKIEKLNEYKKSLIYEYVTGKKEV